MSGFSAVFGATFASPHVGPVYTWLASVKIGPPSLDIELSWPQSQLFTVMPHCNEPCNINMINLN